MHSLHDSPLLTASLIKYDDSSRIAVLRNPLHDDSLQIAVLMSMMIHYQLLY